MIFNAAKLSVIIFKRTDMDTAGEFVASASEAEDVTTAYQDVTSTTLEADRIYVLMQKDYRSAF